MSNDHLAIKNYRVNLSLAIATACLVLVGAITAGLILSELRQLTRQNDVLERTLRQSFIPVGIIGYAPQNLDSNVVGLGFGKPSEPGGYKLLLSPKILNGGTGILFYYGAIAYLSADTLSLRKSILGGTFKGDITFDGMPEMIRGKPLKQDKHYSIGLQFDNLGFMKSCNIYVLCLYKDQEGGLYDTEHHLYVEFGDNFEKIENYIEPTVMRTMTNDTYHQYSESEELELMNFLDKYQHNLAYCLRR